RWVAPAAEGGGGAPAGGRAPRAPPRARGAGGAAAGRRAPRRTGPDLRAGALPRSRRSGRPEAACGHRSAPFGGPEARLGRGRRLRLVHGPRPPRPRSPRRPRCSRAGARPAPAPPLRRGEGVGRVSGAGAPTEGYPVTTALLRIRKP